MSDTVISVEHLSKRYRLGVINTGTFKDDVKVWIAKARGKGNPLARIGDPDYGNRDGDILWALRDVNFTVQRGEALGIIGRNGAGKSTLLKILSRVTTPTEGHVKVKGRIASLLEVGTGFHPELTGRENIFLNGAIMGMDRAEVTRKFDEIVDFSGVEKFIDTPVKRYSSGMYVRLAFAVAAHLEPEILIVDEVLAVGDAEFQKKCLGKMGEVTGEGRTVLFVSHNMGSIHQLCKNGIILEKGELTLSSDISTCISNYLGSNTQRQGTVISHAVRKTDLLNIQRVLINGSDSDELVIFHSNRILQIEMDIDVIKKTKVSLEMKLLDYMGNVIGSFCPAHFDKTKIANLSVGSAKISCEINLPNLTKGNFVLDLFLTNPSVEGLWDIPAGVKIVSEGEPMTTMGTVLDSQSGHGSFIMSGELNVSSDEK